MYVEKTVWHIVLHKHFKATKFTIEMTSQGDKLYLIKFTAIFLRRKKTMRIHALVDLEDLEGKTYFK